MEGCISYEASLSILYFIYYYSISSLAIMKMENLIVFFLFLAAAQGLSLKHNCLTQATHSQSIFFPCCPSTYVFEPSTLSCVCPETTPYVDTAGACVSCFSPRYWNNVTKECLSCPAPRIFDQYAKACVCPDRYYVDVNNNCHPCVDPFFWDQASSTCKQCPTGRIFNSSFGRCVCTGLQPFENSQNQCVSCKQPHYWS